MRKSGSVAAFRKNRDQQNVRVMGRCAVAHKKRSRSGLLFSCWHVRLAAFFLHALRWLFGQQRHQRRAHQHYHAQTTNQQIVVNEA